MSPLPWSGHDWEHERLRQPRHSTAQGSPVSAPPGPGLQTQGLDGLGLVRVTVRRQKISILSFNIPLQSPLWAWCLVEPCWSQQLGDLCWPDWPARNRLSGSRWRYIVSLARLYYLTSWVLGWGPGQCPDSPAVLEIVYNCSLMSWDSSKLEKL